MVTLVGDLLKMQEKDKTFESQTCPFNSENQNAILLTLVILYLTRNKSELKVLVSTNLVRKHSRYLFNLEPDTTYNP